MRGIIPIGQLVFLLSLFINNVVALGATDTTTWGGDNSRTGYQTNHNMDPAIVGSPDFVQIFKAALPGNYQGVPEQIFSQPLVYTPADGIQYLFFATTQNNVYKLNAKTGAIVLKRNLHIPFLTADLIDEKGAGCGDINPHIGVTATGVIDPGSDTLYLTAKTYQNQTAGPITQGRPNGRYYFHAIDVNDLSERAGFPVSLEGLAARNNALRTFNGGIQHQRPALLLTGQYVYAGFASHCVKFNYTGWIMGWDKTTGAIVERYAMEGSPVDSQTQGGGIWMSGGGLASDDAGSIFYATGNGHASQLSTVPVNGHNSPSALEEAAVHMTVNSDGSLTTVDFFMPWDKQALDGGDRDLGTSPLEILPSEFACGSIKRIGVVTSKNGVTYWIDLDNMGGYRNGPPNQLDNVIWTFQNENSVYAGAGVYPLEGGYIYINVIKYPTHIFKFTCTAGVPSFTKVADTVELCAYLGVSHGTTTSLNGKPGTGLFWVSDVNGYNLRVYNAVPSNPQLTLINHFQIPSVAKFTRPVFGNGRVYIGTTAGYLYGFGTLSNPPMNCSAPDFGTVDVQSSTVVKTINCTAKIAFKVTNVTTSNPFSVNGMSALPLAVAAGKMFSFQATFSPNTIGDLSAEAVIATINGATGYSTSTHLTLHGKGESVAPFLDLSPSTISFQAITGQQTGGLNQTLLLINSGDTLLTISGVQYSQESQTGPFTTITSFDSLKVGPFTFYNFPTTIQPNTPSIVTVNFDSSKTGNYSSYFVVNSDGGNRTFNITGVTGDAPVGLIEFQTMDGLGWVQYNPSVTFTFGNVTENQVRFLKLRVTNNASINASPLSLAVSKAPIGNGLINANNLVDLGEGTILAPGESATATLYCSPPKTQWNTDSYQGRAEWTMNMNDPTFGHQDIPFICNAVAEQAPPLLPDGNGQYRYLGCFKENNPGRQLKTQLYGSDQNTNAKCIAACAAGNYVFCGTQYNRECWAGPTVPNLQVDEANCNFPCKGDVNEICGGNGIAGGAYISLFVDSLQGSGSGTGGGPFVNPGVGGYTSIGCYTESTTGRALPNGKTVASKTVANCVSACSGSSYKYAGVEYGGECWCGNDFTAGAIPTAITDCNMPCNDNATEYCGAGKRLNVYQFNALVSSSSSPSSTTSTAAVTSLSSSSEAALSSTSTDLASSSGTSLPSTSTDLASSSGTSLSSTSTDLASASGTSLSSTSTDLASTSATLLSSTSTTLSPTSSSSPASSPTTSIPITTSTLSSTSTSTSATPTGPSIVPSAGEYTYLGCYAEPATGRTLTNLYGIDTLTIELCAAQCAAYTYFGAEYGRECWCGNTLNPASSIAPDSDCKQLCAGNSLEYCGAGQRLNVYVKSSASSSSSKGTIVLDLPGPTSTSSLVVSTAASSSSSALSSTSALVLSSSDTATSTVSLISTSSPSTLPSSSPSTSSILASSSPSTSSAPPAYTGPPVPSSGNENFTYYSCVSEPSSGRLLPSVIENNGTAMSIEKCLENCYMYKYAGVEYGRECWCGDTLNLVGDVGAVPGGKVGDGDCGFVCPGNSSEFCGGRGRMSLFWFDGGQV